MGYAENAQIHHSKHMGLIAESKKAFDEKARRRKELEKEMGPQEGVFQRLNQKAQDLWKEGKILRFCRFLHLPLLDLHFPFICFLFSIFHLPSSAFAFYLLPPFSISNHYKVPPSDNKLSSRQGLKKSCSLSSPWTTPSGRSRRTKRRKISWPG
jgi:hypothetical protein